MSHFMDKWTSKKPFKTSVRYGTQCYDEITVQQPEFSFSDSLEII